MAATKSKGKTAKTSGCSCIDLVNKAIANKNAELDTHFTFGGLSDKRANIGVAMHVALRKVDSTKKTKLPTICPTYCPFCGTKLIDEND